MAHLVSMRLIWFVSGLLIAKAVIQEEVVCGAAAPYKRFLLLGWARLIFSGMVKVEYMTERKKIYLYMIMWSLPFVFKEANNLLFVRILMFYYMYSLKKSKCNFVGQIKRRPYFSFNSMLNEYPIYALLVVHCLYIVIHLSYSA
jgi:hypothetical protein